MLFFIFTFPAICLFVTIDDLLSFQPVQNVVLLFEALFVFLEKHFVDEKVKSVFSLVHFVVFTILHGLHVPILLDATLPIP